MIGLGTGIRGGNAALGKGGGWFPSNTEAAEYFERMSETPPLEQMKIYDNFITQAKSMGAWSALVDCGFLCAHTWQASKLGLKDVINPTEVGANHYHVPNQGWAGDGTTSCLNLGYAIPAGDRNLAGMGLFTTQQNGILSADMGNDSCALLVRGADNKSYFRMNSIAGTTASVDQQTAVGLFYVKRSASAGSGEDLWWNGANIGVTGLASEVPDTKPIYLGGRNRTSGVTYTSRAYQFWFIGALPDAVIPAFSTLVNDTVALLRAAGETAIPNLTRETRSLLRTITKYTQRREWTLGGFDNYNWFNTLLAPETELRFHVDDMLTVTGKHFAVVTYEYQDVAVAGEVAVDVLRQKIIAQHAGGGIVWISDHCGNPVTGSLGQEASASSPGTVGNQYDRNGSPIVACLTGGSKAADFEAYVQRIAAFLASLVDASGNLIPVVWRPFHEMNLGSFWWSDTVTPLNTLYLFRRFVNLMRANGVRNALIDWCPGSTITNERTFFPGADYCDLISATAYDDRSDLGLVTGMPHFGSGVSFLINPANGMLKPHRFSEFGWQYGSHGISDIWTAKTGNIMKTNFHGVSGATVWRSPWGVSVNMGNSADFIAMVGDTACHTRDKLSGVYTDTTFM